MPKLQSTIALLVLIALCSCGGSGGSDSSNPTSYSSAVAYIESEGFVGTILVRKNDDYLLRKGYGYADQSQQQPNGIDTRYRIGSLTKAFTALAIVQLKNANIISSYDDPIASYISDYPRGDKISIRDILQHRSGITEYLSSVNPQQAYTPTELVNLFKNVDLDFEPGQAFSYSNSNYILLGHLVEELSGTGYENYLNTNIWSMLGMVNTEYGKSVIEGSSYAKGYTDVSQQQTADFLDMSIPYAAGAISANIVDMELWAESFLTKTLISEQDALEIFAEGDYGFGWVVTQIAGKLAYAHAGGIQGFSSIIVIFPQEDAFIVALSNVQGEQEKLNRIAATITENEL